MKPHEHSFKGVNNPNWRGGKVTKLCTNCGDAFEPTNRQLKRGFGKYCSRICYGQHRKKMGGYSGSNNAAWKGGRLERVCQNCNKIFKAKRRDVKNGYGKYCSKSCRMIRTQKSGKLNIKPNKPEKILIRLFKDHGLPFRYVGDGKVWLGKHNPDFININGKKQVVELFGTYWHPRSDEPKWKKDYEEYGFDCLVIWENDLNDLEEVANKIKTYENSKSI